MASVTRWARPGTVSVADPFRDLLATRWGRAGTHARHRGATFNATPWAMLLAAISWLVVMARQLPCHQTDVYKPINNFYRLCYSDIPVLYQTRNLATGQSPYGLEYPVLTGAVIDIGRRISQLLGAPTAQVVTAQQSLAGAHIFFAVTAVLMFAGFVVAVLAQIDSVRTRPFDALMVAGAPVVMAAGLINWDMLCIALCSLAVWAWARRRPGIAGLLIGLGVAAKLYPGLLLIPLAVLCLRSNKFKEYAACVGGAIIGWVVPNGLSFAHNRADWEYFYTFNVDRGGDLGSIWYVLSLAGVKIGNVNAIIAVLLVIGTLAICALGLLAPRRPRLGQLAFLMVALFLILNKVYSPQYVLWLLPFVVLARPRWTDYLVWTIAELAYFAAIWGHLAQTMLPAGGTADKLYWASVILRVGVEVWLMALVVRDILHPREDVVRADGSDDPSGGVLDGSRDAGWVRKLQYSILGRPAEDAYYAPSQETSLERHPSEPDGYVTSPVPADAAPPDPSTRVE